MRKMSQSRVKTSHDFTGIHAQKAKTLGLGFIFGKSQRDQSQFTASMNTVGLFHGKLSAEINIITVKKKSPEGVAGL